MLRSARTRASSPSASSSRCAAPPRAEGSLRSSARRAASCALASCTDKLQASQNTSSVALTAHAPPFYASHLLAGRSLFYRAALPPCRRFINHKAQIGLYYLHDTALGHIKFDQECM